MFLLRDYIGKKQMFVVKHKTGNHSVVDCLKFNTDIEGFEIVPKGLSELKDGIVCLLKKHDSISYDKHFVKPTIIDAAKRSIPLNNKRFGVLVSGGLDSSIIASIISKYSDSAIYYTLGNTEDSFFVATLSKYLNIQNRIRTVQLPKANDIGKLIDKVVYCTESYNPSIVSNGLATYLLLEQAYKDGIEVVVSGEGADELFCGYRISKNADKTFENRVELIENMHFTELRRVEMIAMACSVEVRCPFLAREVFRASNGCVVSDLIDLNFGKHILRQEFVDYLPDEIIRRDKMSFDVGSGIRRMVVEYLTKDGLDEKTVLKGIWSKYFDNKLSGLPYFHSYPTFDEAIKKRGVGHKNSELLKIETLIREEFRSVPFHNLFMFNNIEVIGSDKGGTCSDRVLHFRRVLVANGYKVRLHSVFINDVDCHRLLVVEIGRENFLVDVGSGWPSVKPFPMDSPCEYSVYGMTFKTELRDDVLLLYHKIGDGDFRLMERIPLNIVEEDTVYKAVAHRFSGSAVYPFQDSLRFSQVLGDDFYFLKGNVLSVYNEFGVHKTTLSDSDIRTLLEDKFSFRLSGLGLKKQKISLVAVVATKNRSSFLRDRALKSIAAQNRLPDMVVVVDDSDESIHLVENKDVVVAFAQELAGVEFCYILNYRTHGASGSWNSAVDFLLRRGAMPENTYLAILDDDDEWLPDYLETCCNVIGEQGRIDMVACDICRITEQGQSVSMAPEMLLSDDFLVGNPGVQGSNIFVRLSRFLEAGCFDENLKSCTDRDLCIRLADLGCVRYERVARPLVNHYAEWGRARLSTPNSEAKNFGLFQFWLKHSKRMSVEQKEAFLQRAKRLFDWDLSYYQSDSLHADNIKTECIIEDGEDFMLCVGVICSSYSLIQHFLEGLYLLKSSISLRGIDVFIFENSLSVIDKTKIFQRVEQLQLTTVFISPEMQDNWLASNSYFSGYVRNRNGMFSIAQARTLLQKYIGQTVISKGVESVVWIMDEDMQITERTIKALKHLPCLKRLGVDVVIGNFDGSSPNPPLNGVRGQLVDFWNNLLWLSNFPSNSVMADLSNENAEFRQRYSDYYYDLSRRHFGHLEHPVWLEPSFDGETVGDALRRLVADAQCIFGGIPLSRPLRSVLWDGNLGTVKDSVNRGGNTFVFDPLALVDVPNLSIRVGCVDMRRSDMIWAIINRYYRRRKVISVGIPVFHAGRNILSSFTLDIDKLREEFVGAALYAALTDFFESNPEHCLAFVEQEVKDISMRYDMYVERRLVWLKESFYRAIGVSKCLQNWLGYAQYSQLIDLVGLIQNTFSWANFIKLEQRVREVCFSDIVDFLTDLVFKTDEFKEVKL